MFINDSLFVSGDIKAEGSTAVVFKDKVAVNEIIPDDSSAVKIAVLDVHNIINSSSSFIQIGEGLNVNGSIQTNGSVTAGTSFIIGDADINETDLEKKEQRIIISPRFTKTPSLNTWQPTIRKKEQNFIQN